MVQTLTRPPEVRGKWLPMSYDEWLAWAPDSAISEWVDGEGIIYMPPDDQHNWLALTLYDLFREFGRVSDLGIAMAAPYEVKLWPGGPSREPDVLFLRKEHLDRWHGKRLIGPPDLAVEIISDDSVGEDTKRKYAQYESIGVPEYLWIDPRPNHRRFAFHRLDADGRYQPVEPDEQGRYHSSVMPGFWFLPRWFWQEPLPDAKRLLLEIAPDAYRRYLLSLLEQAEREG